MNKQLAFTRFLQLLPWIIFGIVSLGLFFYYLKAPVINYGGDIAEYYGITESLIKDGKFYLTDTTADTITRYLQPAYLNDPGYYLAGRDGYRYPVHFVFYSLLATPERYVLHFLHINELNTLRVTNFFLFTITAWIVLRFFLKSSWKRIIFLIIFYFSPLIWFINWPGPDVYYCCLLLLSIFSFGRKHYLWSVFLAVLASWQSQPILLLAFGLLLYSFVVDIKAQSQEGILHIHVPQKLIGITILLIFLTSIPYLYNLYAFGVLTPWTILKDGWTQINGFGIQNISILKLYEQLFDLNVGLFWYAPVITIVGLLFFIYRSCHYRQALFLLIMLFLTAFAYQTNPAWHYGTAGY